MAGRILLGLGNPALDENGAVQEGALFYYYINGTTTLQNIYGSKADAEAGTNALANPVEANDAGRTPDIWSPDDYVYEVLWTDSDGVPIRTFSDIEPIVVDAVDTSGEPGVYYLENGPGVLDGTDVDVPALNGYIDTITATPGVLKLPPITLAMSDKSLVLKAGVPLVGQGKDLTTLDFSADPDWADEVGMITAEGTGPGTWNPVTLGITKFNTTVQVSGDTSEYTDGCHVMIRSTEFGLPQINDVYHFPWAATAAIVKGDLTWANGNWYICTTAGTTGATAPTSISNPVTDGSAVLYYIDYANSQNQQRWTAAQAVALGDFRVTTQGYILICCTAGTTAATQPVFSPGYSISTITDGTAVWRYGGYYNSTKGEIKLYGFSRVSGGVIYLNEAIEDSYPLSYTGVNFTVEIAPVSLAEITLEDMTIRGSGHTPIASMTQVGSGTASYWVSSQYFDIGVQVKWCILNLHRVRFIDVEQFCWHRMCAVVRTFDCEYLHSPYHIESQQYGGYAQSAGDVIEQNPFGLNNRHLNDGDGGGVGTTNDYLRGIPGAIEVYGSKSRGGWQSVVGNHRASRYLVCVGFDWTTDTGGFKPRCPDVLLGDGIIRGPKYATAEEYLSQDGLVTFYYQATRATVYNVRTEGGAYGLRISNTDGGATDFNIQMDIVDPFLYGARIGVVESDVYSNMKLDLRVSGVVTYDNILIDGTCDNSAFKLHYDGGRKGLTSNNKKPALTNCTFDVTGADCDEEALDLYNVNGGHIYGGVRQSNTTNVINRLKDCRAVTIDRATTIGPATGFAGEFWKIQATALTPSYINMADQVCYTSSGIGGTGLTVEANVSNSNFGAINTPHTIKISAGVNSTNVYADAPNNVQDAAYAFIAQDAAPGRTVTHTSGSAHTWTLNQNVFPVGARITLANNGSGAVSVARGAGISIRLAGADANRSIAQYGSCILVQVATDAWLVQAAVLTT